MGAKIQADEISSIIKERIDNFELNVDVNETGKIISYADGIAQVYGLKNVMAGELVEFENGERGLASNLEESQVGVVYTNQVLSNDYVSSIEEQFSKKFNVKLSLTQNVCDYDGIKVDIDGLGVEISFSKERLKSQLIDHILKAV